jgi:protein arginine kinase activator
MIEGVEAMKCEICSERDAVIHVQQIIGGESVEVHLCADCANRRGISRSEDRIELSLSQLLSGLVGAEGAGPARPAPQECSNCGLSLEDFRRTGRAGCPECYLCFREEISALHKELSGATRHTGKIPERLRSYKTLLIDREKLRAQLDEAVSREDYEAAAELRDRIQAIERTNERT